MLRNLYNKGKTRNFVFDGIILADFGSTRRYPCLHCLWPSLSQISFYHPPVFATPRTTSSLPAHWLLLLLSFSPCLPACIYFCPPAFVMFPITYLRLSQPFITSCTLSFHHHVSLSPGGLRPVVMPNTSCHTLNNVVLVFSHHSCTLSTGPKPSPRIVL